MTLQDIFDQLSHGELSEVFAGQQGADGQGISEDNRKKVFLSVSLGLTELHKRFLLREKRLKLTMVPDKTHYLIDPRYAQSNASSNEQVKYIQDTPDDPFEGQIFKVERVYDAEGAERSLNRVDDPDSFQTNSYNSLMVPVDYDQGFIELVCRADHPEIKHYMATGAPSQVPISLPGSHLYALLLFVASRILSPVGMVSEFHQGNNYLAKFEAEVARLTTTHYEERREHITTRFRDNGWV